MSKPPADDRRHEVSPLDGPAGDDWIAVTDVPLPVAATVEWATTPRCGAVVSFLGVVRDHADGRDGVTGMTYEAYREPTERVLREIVAEARRRWPDLGRVVVLHRVGEVALSEPSVQVVVAAPHRDHAFDAARYCIDTLKQTAPIWKQEHWTGGSDWAVEQHPIRPVRTDPAVRPETVRSGRTAGSG